MVKKIVKKLGKVSKEVKKEVIKKETKKVDYAEKLAVLIKDFKDNGTEYNPDTLRELIRQTDNSEIAQLANQELELFKKRETIRKEQNG